MRQISEVCDHDLPLASPASPQRGYRANPSGIDCRIWSDGSPNRYDQLQSSEEPRQTLPLLVCSDRNSQRCAQSGGAGSCENRTEIRWPVRYGSILMASGRGFLAFLKKFGLV